MRKNPAEAIPYIALARTYVGQLKTDTARRIGVYNITGVNYARAIDHYRQALAIWEKLGYLDSQAEVWGNLGVAYELSEQLNKAIDCHIKAIEIDKQTKNDDHLAGSYNNLAYAY